MNTPHRLIALLFYYSVYVTIITGKGGDIITYNDFLDSLKGTYSLVCVLSERNNETALRMRNITFQKDIVLHKYQGVIPACEMLKTIRHENLPVVYDTYFLDDAYVVIEEFLSGVTVADVLQTGLYKSNGAKLIISKLCDALAPLHRNGIVHRDIKPENVIITDSGEVKLIDFNISRNFDKSKINDTQVMGTIGYASPEQLGISQSDTRTDIYALGVLLNVMLTGSHPSKTLAKGRAGRIVLKCTQIDPDKRYQSVEALQAEL